jgi:hypothetical protein
VKKLGYNPVLIMLNIRYFSALILVILFQFITDFFHPISSPSAKGFITLLIWGSFFLSFSTFYHQYSSIKTDLPKFSFIVFLLIIFWNIINIFRSAINHDGSLLTLLGNPVTSLALLVPFSLAFYFSELNFKTLNKFFFAAILIAIPFYIVFYIFSNGSKEIHFNRAFFSLIFGTNFLIPLFNFFPFKKKFLILAGTVLLYYLALVTEYRIGNVRIILLFLILFSFLFFYRINKKVILITSLLSLSIPFIFFYQALHTGESPFEKYQPNRMDEKLTTDTRTFLYQEVLEDLDETNSFLLGKGSNGSYYSAYFDQYGGDTEKRLSVEVGILAVLLKGGLIAVILNLALIFSAIFYALFKSNNDFIVLVGLMLILHVIIFFITNYLDYSLYNVVIWFFIGLCLSKKIRDYSDQDIRKLFFYE